MLTLVVGLALVATACTTGGSESAGALATAPGAVEGSAPATGGAPNAGEAPLGAGDSTATPGSAASTCAGRPSGQPVPWETQEVAEAQRLIDGPITVDAVVYPRPDYEGRPWSQWGQGIVLDDGRFLSAMGDHRGVDGNSYLFEYDPAAEKLTRIADAISLAGHEPGAWGYGKIHAQMVPGPCGEVLVTTYWGSRRNLEFTDSYQGDLLFRLDPEARTVENLGVFFERHGVPSLAGVPGLGLLYGEAVDPLAPPGTGGSGSFVVRDAGSGTLVFVDDNPDHAGFRSIAVAGDGRAFYSLRDGGLAMYDPLANASAPFPASLPGEVLRAATPPTESGSILGVTDKPAVFFELDPAGTVRTISDAAGYTTSIARSPDASTIYYVPDAHGGSWQQGTPLIAVDVASGEQTRLLELNPAAEAKLGLRLGGTYSVTIDDSGRTLYLGMNAGPTSGQRDAFGEVVLLVVSLP